MPEEYPGSEQHFEPSTEVMVADRGRGAPAAVSTVASQGGQLTASDVWSSLLDMAKDESVDADKLRALTDIQGTMIAQVNSEKDREAKARFDRALSLACADMPVITKDNKIQHKGQFIGWFKKYEDIRDIVDKIIRPFNLNITHDSSEIDGGKGGILVWTVISYVDSEHTWSEERAKIPVPPDTGGAKGAGQALGSSMTYGQRYSLVGAFGIVQRGLDKDGSTDVAMIELKGKEAELLKDAEECASRGGLPYRAYFDGLTNHERTLLVRNGKDDRFPSHHERLKSIAQKADEAAGD